MSIIQFRRAKLLQDAKLSGVTVADIARAMANMDGIHALSRFDDGFTSPISTRPKRCSTWPLNVPLNVAAAIDPPLCVMRFLTTAKLY